MMSISFRPGLFLKARVFHLTDQADDFILCRRVEGDALPPRIFTPPEFARHRFIDDDDTRGLSGVALIEAAATHQPHAERLEVIGADGAPPCIERLSFRQGRASDNLK